MKPRIKFGVKLLPLPMFGRIFIALIALTIAAAAMIGATFGAYQERVTAMTLAPMWAAAIKSAQEQPTDSQPEPPRRELELNMRVSVLAGPPPAQAYSIASDRRTVALVDALAEAWHQHHRHAPRRHVGIAGHVAAGKTFAGGGTLDRSGGRPTAFAVSCASLEHARFADPVSADRGVVHQPLGGAPDGAPVAAGRRDRPRRSADRSSPWCTRN